MCKLVDMHILGIYINIYATYEVTCNFNYYI